LLVDWLQSCTASVIKGFISADGNQYRPGHCADSSAESSNGRVGTAILIYEAMFMNSIIITNTLLIVFAETSEIATIHRRAALVALRNQSSKGLWFLNGHTSQIQRGGGTL
jgi:hypothetical protein